MLQVAEQLNNVLKGVNVCALCLNVVQENACNMFDIVDMKNTNVLSIYDVITFILGPKFLENTTENMSKVCMKCLKSAVSCYTFMEVCRTSQARLLALVDNLNSSLSNQHSSAKTLFITVGSDLSPKLYFHTKKRAKTKQDAIKCLASKLDPCNIMICSDCGKTYNNMNNFKRHLDSHEDRTCPKCGKHYKSTSNYEKHLSQQTCNLTSYYDSKKAPDYKYECDVCKRQFTNKSALRLHITFEHENGKAFYCPWCKKKFAAPSFLKGHIIKHTKERRFTCEICKDKFVTKQALLYHTRLHTGERPYPCPECGERFLSTSRRTEHLRMKHWAPTLQCDKCPSKFKKSSSFKRHHKRHFDPKSKLYILRHLIGYK